MTYKNVDHTYLINVIVNVNNSGVSLQKADMQSLKVFMKDISLFLV